MTQSGWRKFAHIAFSLPLLVVLVFGTTQPAAAATILYVNAATGNDAHSGASWGTAFRTLQKALGVAASGEQIWVAKGTYKPTARPVWPNDPRGAAFSLISGVAIFGGFAGTETAVSQRNWKANITMLSGDIGTVGVYTDDVYDVVWAGNVNSTAILDGFYIAYGSATGCGCYPGDAGGGILLEGSSPKLRNLVITHNAASGYGGGLSNFGSSPTLVNVTFSANQSDYVGGAMDNESSSNPTLTNVAFVHNKVKYAPGYGGAMYDDGGHPVLNHVTFKANTSAGVGGGMYNKNGANATLSYVTFTGNSAGSDGGALYDDSSSPTMTNVTFSANNSSGNGGGIYETASSPTLTTVTFSGNTATGSGGGIYNTNASTPTLTGVSFTGNKASANGGGIFSDSGSAVLSHVKFISNTATTYGGGLDNDGLSMPTITNAVFSANSAGDRGGAIYNTSVFTLTDATFSTNAATNYGGAMFNVNNNPILSNVTFDANTASSGAGIFSANGNPSLTNATFAANIASTNGGALFIFAGTPTVYDSAFWGDSPQEILSGSLTLTDSLVQGGCPSSGATCTNVQGTNPRLGPLQNNGGSELTMALGVGSAAIDAGGGNSTCSSADERGVSRPQGAACDIGAYEVRTKFFPSQAVYDGFVREYSAGSGTGGPVNTTSTTMLVGDDAYNRRDRGFISFNTAAIPDAATVVKAQLDVFQQSMTGTPFSNNAALVADVAEPYFGAGPGLLSSDWQATTTNVVNNVASFGTAAVPNLSAYTAWLNGYGLSHIDKTGTTQFRLHFSTADAFSKAADYVSLYTGEVGTPPGEPGLTVYYNP